MAKASHMSVAPGVSPHSASDSASCLNSPRIFAQALPGGYNMGEMVFYTGANETFPNGDKLEPGRQGEVVGPGPSTAPGIHESVSVLFPGNKGTIGCYFEAVRHRCSAREGSGRALPAYSLSLVWLRVRR